MMSNAGMADKHPHSALIDAVGAKAVRTAFDVKPMNIYTWRVRGIPERYKVAFNRLAGEHGVAVPPDFFAGMV